jgi:hypothetical protein
MGRSCMLLVAARLTDGKIITILFFVLMFRSNTFYIF